MERRVEIVYGPLVVEIIVQTHPQHEQNSLEIYVTSAAPATKPAQNADGHGRRKCPVVNNSEVHAAVAANWDGEVVCVEHGEVTVPL